MFNIIRLFLASVEREKETQRKETEKAKEDSRVRIIDHIVWSFVHKYDHSRQYLSRNYMVIEDTQEVKNIREALAKFESQLKEYQGYADQATIPIAPISFPCKVNDNKRATKKKGK